MFLASGPSFEWGKFLQVLSWIVLPVLIAAILITVFFHYRRKKRNRDGLDDKENDFVLATPEQFIHKKEDGEYVFFDHSNLIVEYKKRMFYNHARFVSLQKDYTNLETKYSALLKDKKNHLKTNKKTSHMKNPTMQISPAETTNIPGDVIAKELQDKLEALNKSYQRVQEENRFLQEQVSLQTATGDEKEKIINRWKEDFKSLRDKMAEQEYLHDLLEEKNAQIIFLQSQSEQRIKTQHQNEHQRLEAIKELEQLQEIHREHLSQIESLKNGLLQKQESADKLQVVLCEKEELLALKEQEFVSKADRVTYLENILKETKEQNELLNAEAADTRDTAMVLKEQLEKEQARSNFLEQKLESSRQLLKRLYKEISSSINADGESSPVIGLSPVYVNKETAV